ncbi:MAG TPA: extracellular solute-binding protein [Acholeplasma sp.]|nr:extracellular solute-binding protein [Acholeplasma sp.]
MKKILSVSITSLIAVIAIAFTVVSLSGCGKKADPCITPTGGQSVNVGDIVKAKQEVSLWIDGEGYGSALKEAFEAKYPNYVLKVESVGSVDTRAKLELQGKQGADVIVFPHDHIGLALQSKVIQKVPTQLANKFRDDMLDATITTVESEGELYGVPLQAESIALFANMKLVQPLIDSNQLPADFTFDDIIALAKTYNNRTESKYLLGIDIDDYYVAHMFFTSFGVELFGPNHDDPTKLGAEDPKLVQALSYIYEQYATKEVAGERVRILPETATLTGDFLKTQFDAGNLPFMFSGPWGIEASAAASVAGTIELKLMKIPTITVGGKAVNPVTFSGVQVAAVSSYTSVPTAAFALLEFLSSEEGLTIMYDNTGKLPALKDISNIPGLADDEYLQGISAQLAYSQPMPSIPQMGFVWNTYATMIATVFNGVATPADAAANAKTNYEALAGLTD